MLQETQPRRKGSAGQAVAPPGLPPRPSAGAHLALYAGRFQEEVAMDLIVTLIIGGIVGWLASILMRTNAQMGILANVLVGIIGSFVGHAIANALHLGPRGSLANWVISILGAALLIAVLSVLGVFRRPAR